VKLDPAFPYFGSKAAAVDLIWEAFGDPLNFVDCTTGTSAVTLGRPGTDFSRRIETLNDAWGFIPNFLRAVTRDPRRVAQYADWPVSELDMHARHAYLLKTVNEAFVERLRDDESFFDAKVAGFWVYGQSIWIGSGWCDPAKRVVHRRLPFLQGAGASEKDRHPHYGKGIFRLQLPAPPGVDTPTRRDILVHYFRLIARRLERCRFTCGDWRRVVEPSVTISHGLTAVFMDPPYGKEAKRTTNLHAVDSENVADDMREWCIENGSNPLLRIILCGYEGEHEELAQHGWRAVSWRNRGGYGNQDGENANADRERLWLSPHCLNSQGAQLSLLDKLSAPS
jgi:hypothetical protein